MNTLTSDEIDKSLKVRRLHWHGLKVKEMQLDWAQDLLFMAVYGFAKLSVVSLLRRFTLGKRDRLLLYCFEWFLAFWTICAEAVWCFECHLPRPWDYLHESCINRVCYECRHNTSKLIRPDNLDNLLRGSQHRHRYDADHHAFARHSVPQSAFKAPDHFRVLLHGAHHVHLPPHIKTRSDQVKASSPPLSREYTSGLPRPRPTTPATIYTTI